MYTMDDQKYVGIDFSGIDFTLDYYAQMLNVLKNEYVFIPYQHYEKEGGNYMLLRHDVAFSPERALSMAVVENRVGVTATYFINPHSDWYNAFDKRSTTAINRILELGHYIGLNMDLSYWNVPLSCSPINRLVDKEKKLLESVYDVVVSAMSFNNPTTSTLELYREETYGGLINTNGVKLRTLYQYVSDSSYNKWNIINYLGYKGPQRVQLLLHPIWWTYKKMCAVDKVRTYIVNSANNKMSIYTKARKVLSVTGLGV